MRNGVIATGMLALALLGSACGQNGKGTPHSQGGGGPYKQPTSAPPMSPPMQTQTQMPPGSPSESVSPSVSGSMMPPTGPATVDAKSTSIGSILVDGKGRTVYAFEKDTAGKPTCTGACAKEWPPFLTQGKPTAGSGVNGGWVGMVQTSDGKTQVTYHGHPLYYYAGDTQPGQMKGQGMSSNGGRWYVVGARTGAPVMKAAPSVSPSGSPGSPGASSPEASPTR